jgi:16S rRNA C1402 N4-methylase RsmH
VKAAFREGLAAGVYEKISPDPVIANEAAQKLNPRSRSAKLRWGRTRYRE